MPASISSLERFILPALPAFAPLPPGGEALLVAELDADARAVAASDCFSWYFAMRMLRAAFCSSLSVFGEPHMWVQCHMALMKRFSHASFLMKAGRSSQS